MTDSRTDEGTPRTKDRADLIELIKSGIDVARCKSYLQANVPAFIAALDTAVAAAAREEDE